MKQNVYKIIYNILLHLHFTNRLTMASLIKSVGTRFWRWFALPLEIGVFTLLVALMLGKIRRKYDILIIRKIELV